MGGYIAFIISFISAYFIGSFPTSYLMAKWTSGLDIRQVGSKNAGATNVFRTVGKAAGAATLVIDILKGFLTVTLVTNFFYNFEINLDYDFYRMFMGSIAVAGHIWPVFLKFRGGKGVATTIGVALGVAPAIFLPSLIIWIIVFFLTNYVSLASIIALISFPIIAAALRQSIYLVLFSVIICSISVFKHRTNISRLLKGEENKTLLFKPR